MESIEAVRAFAALAQENRLAIFRLLARVGPAGLSVGEIGRSLGIGPTNLSFHLKELDRAGLLSQAREGRFIRYTLRTGGVRRMVEFLTQECCGSRPELCGPAFGRGKACRRSRENEP
ncbi:MAG: metalloregulator ArsR/SmtB family transcription factor [Rhodomicrobium sp.]